MSYNFIMNDLINDLREATTVSKIYVITYKIIWRQNDTNNFALLAFGFETMKQNVNVHANYCGQYCCRTHSLVLPLKVS